MAIKVAKKIKHTAGKEPPPPPTDRPRSEERAQDDNESQKNIADLQERIMNFDPKKPGVLAEEAPPAELQPPPASTELKKEAAPVGGRESEQTPPAPPAAVITPPPPEAGGIETKEQLRARLDQIQPGNQQQVKGYSTLKDVILEKNDLALNERARADKLSKELEETRTKLIPEDELKTLREAREYVNQRAIEALPKWKEFDQEIDKISGQAEALLKEFNIRDNLIASIKERGGIIKFSSSKTPSGLKNPDGSEMTQADYFQRYIYDKLDPRQRNMFDAMTTEAFRKQTEKDEAIKTARGKSAETLKAEADKFWKSFSEECGTELKTKIGTELPKFDFPTSPPVITGNESPEEKAKKEKDLAAWNKASKAIDPMIFQLGRVYKPKSAVDIALKAVMHDALIDRVSDLQEQLKTITKERDDLKKFKEEGKAARRLRDATPGPLQQGDVKEREYANMSSEEALAAKGFPVNAATR